jgi:hypothetical protein
MTPRQQASDEPDGREPARRHLRAVPDRPVNARYTFGILHADTPGFDGPARAETFYSLAPDLQLAAWKELAAEVEVREQGERFEVVG